MMSALDDTLVNIKAGVQEVLVINRLLIILRLVSHDGYWGNFGLIER